MAEKRTGYLGEQENERLEFKTEDAPDERLLAAIVAFLNTTRGGSLVIGVKDEHGVAVAEPGVRSPSALRDRLLDKAAAFVDPPPGDLLGIRLDHRPSGATLVLVDVKPSRRGPHALRSGTGLSFFVRERATTRSLNRGELVRWLRAPAGGRSASGTRSSAGRAFAEGLACTRRGAALGGVSLFVGLHPADGVAASTDAAWRRAAERAMAALRQDNPFGLPASTRDWSLALAPHYEPQLTGSRILFGREQPLDRIASVRRKGTVWGAMRLAPGWPGIEPSRPPTIAGFHVRDLAVIAYTLSIVRLAQLVWNEMKLPGNAQARAALYSEKPVGWLSSLPGGRGRRSTLVESPLDTGPLDLEMDLRRAPDQAAEQVLAHLRADGQDAWRRYWNGSRFVLPG